MSKPRRPAASLVRTISHTHAEPAFVGHPGELNPPLLSCMQQPLAVLLLQCGSTRFYLLPVRHAGNGLGRGYFFTHVH